MPLLAIGELGYAGYPAGVVLDRPAIDLGDLQLGRVDDYGGQWNITAFTGRGSAPSAVEASQRTAGHGSWIGGRWWAAKPYSIDVAYEGATPEDRFAAEARLLDAAGLEDTDLVVHEEVPRRTSVVLNGEVVIDPVNACAFTAQVPLLAADPFRYALEPYTDDTGLPSQTGGLEWPAAWPAIWDAVTISGVLAVTNDGTQVSYPLVRVYGPLPDFTLSNPDTGDWLTVDLGADGESLADGEWLEVDMARQRVMLLGQSSRRRALRGAFFGLPPGPSAVMFGSSLTNGTAFVEIEGYSAWI
ncbi:MAG: hypothetical protein ACRD0P_03330 [Stackebrandtia sp.]